MLVVDMLLHLLGFQLLVLQGTGLARDCSGLGFVEICLVILLLLARRIGDLELHKMEVLVLVSNFLVLPHIIRLFH